MATPAFFKILLDPSSPYLALPPKFVRTHLRDKIREDPKVKIETEEFSWRLKIKKIGDNYCFADGWSKFVKDAHLGFGDFIVFWFIDYSTFQVSIYDPNGCQKSLSSVSNKKWCRRNGGQSLKVEKEMKNECNLTEEEGDGDYPCFQKIISLKTHRYILRLPNKFVEAAKLATKNSLILKDLKGNDWPMNVHIETSWGDRRYLATEWPVFRRYNELSEGDICLFKFIMGKLVLTQVIKKKEPPKNGGFRPPPPPLAGKRHATPSDARAVKSKKGMAAFEAFYNDIKSEE